MAYRLKPGDKSLEAALRRIAVEQIDRALADLDSDRVPLHETIHQLRKRAKKLRGLIRLVRPAFPDYKAENRSLRDAARRLSALRDRETLVATFDTVTTGLDAGMAAQVMPFRDRLAKERDAAGAAADLPERLEDFRATMIAARARALSWRLSEEGFAAVAGGAALSYGRARKAMKKARKSPCDARVHDWRKRVKYHWYHARLLAPLWPRMMQARSAAAKELGELLGDHHDLAVFRAALSEDPPVSLKSAARRALDRLAAGRQDALFSDAQTLGARLFADRPDALLARWQVWWTVWQGSGREISPVRRQDPFRSTRRSRRYRKAR